MKAKQKNVTMVVPSRRRPSIPKGERTAGIFLSLLFCLLLCTAANGQNRDLRAERIVIDDNGSDGTTNTITLQAPIPLLQNIILTLPDPGSESATLLLAPAGSSGIWLLDGNAGTTPGTQYLGTTDTAALHLYVNGGDGPNSNSFILNTNGSIQRDTGGAPRGISAVDLQLLRADSTDVASGDYSVVLGGGQNTASGQVAVAMGASTLASGSISTAMGSGSRAEGSSSTAMGNGTSATGNNATAMGNGTSATGANATAMGELADATARSSTAMGQRTRATAARATAMGWESEANGIGSTAMGINTQAEGRASTATGENTRALGDMSFAAGRNSAASGVASVALGDSSSALGEGAFAGGKKAHAGAYAAVAIGERVVILDSLSIAIGTNLWVEGKYAVAIGSDILATADYATAIGSRLYTRNRTGAFLIGDRSSSDSMEPARSHEFSARFENGYRFFTDSLLTEGTGMFLAPAGDLGLGVNTPTEKLEIHDGNLLLSNSGTAGELRFAEPSAAGTNYSAFRAGSQTADILYTLPGAPPVADGYLLSSTTGGVMSWSDGLQVDAAEKLVKTGSTFGTVLGNPDTNDDGILDATVGGADTAVPFGTLRYDSGTDKVQAFVGDSDGSGTDGWINLH